MVWYDLKKLVLPHISGDSQGNIARQLYSYTYSIKKKKQDIQEIIFYRENITTTECKIADTSKKLVEVEFKLEKLKEEVQKEKVHI